MVTFLQILLGPIGDKYGAQLTFASALVISSLSMVQHFSLICFGISCILVGCVIVFCFVSFTLNKATDQLAIASHVCWYGDVLWREDGHVLRRTLDFEVEDQRKKERLMRTWKMQVEEEIVKVGLRREVALCRSKWGVGVS